MSGDSERITGNSDITRLGKSCRPSGSWPDQSMQGRFGGNLTTLRLCFRFARHPSAIGGRVLMDLPTSHSGTSGPRNLNVEGKLSCAVLPRLIAGGFI